MVAVTLTYLMVAASISMLVELQPMLVTAALMDSPVQLGLFENGHVGWQERIAAKAILFDHFELVLFPKQVVNQSASTVLGDPVGSLSRGTSSSINRLPFGSLFPVDSILMCRLVLGLFLFQTRFRPLGTFGSL